METIVESESPVPDDWPTLATEAFYGLAGEIVRELILYTEADAVALLSHLLAEFSCYIGHGQGPRIELGGLRQPSLFWTVNTGPTSKGRKGTAKSEVRVFMEQAFPQWSKGQRQGNLSSGEGLADAVRDADGLNQGVSDKRLYLVQEEFGSMLKIMGREGNSLSGMIRDAWDGNDLAPLTKNSLVRATKPHIVIVGHVTDDEIRKELKETERCNGFGNRFVWLSVRRSKVMPFPPARKEARLFELANRLRDAGTFAHTIRTVVWSDEGKAIWEQVYPNLSEGRPGPVGALLGRAEAHVGRLAGLYALLDQQLLIEKAHVEAALALWNYSEASVELIFGSQGSTAKDEHTLLVGLVREGQLADTAISMLFGRNRTAQELEKVKQSLLRQGLAHYEQTVTGGRPCRIWKPGPQPK